MGLNPTLRLRFLIALYAFGVGPFIFISFSFLLPYIWSDQYYCYYEIISSRNLVICLTYAATSFCLLPHFFTAKFYDQRRALLGSVVNFSLAMIFLILLLSIKGIGNSYFPLENLTVLEVLLAKSGVLLTSSHTASPLLSKDSISALLIYYLLGIFLSNLFGMAFTRILYSYTYKHNNEGDYWR